MPKEWWKTFFNEDYVNIWGQRNTFKGTKREVDFLEKAVPLGKNQRILDLCCGHGRHSLELVRRGHSTTGLDFSRYELELAREAAKKAKLEIEFIQGDARRFRFTKKFDVILNLFTAFGYGTREDDVKILRSVNSNLKDGGKFVIDYMNAFWLWRNYKPKQTWKLDKLLIKGERKYNFLENINEERLTITRNNKKKTLRQMRLRIYDLAGFKLLLEGQGLRIKKVWGSYDGKPYNFDTKRTIILAEKKQ